MKFTSAVFCFSDKERQNTVSFTGESVTVSEGETIVLELVNVKRQYKPCVTHCLELIRSAYRKPPSTEFSKQRESNQWEKGTQLRLVGGDRPRGVNSDVR